MRRKYKVLPEDAEILFKGNPSKIREIVKEYQPIIYQKRILKGYAPSFMLYEAIDRKEEVMINYYTCWKDEIHPFIIIHFLYKIFRILYYGSSYDIEFITLIIDKSSGEILKLEMESDSHNNPHTFFSDHIKLSLEKNKDNYYDLKIKNKFAGKIHLPKQDNRVKIEAITWNHVYGIYKEGEDYLEFKEIPLVYLTDKLYKKYRIFLRSKPPIPYL